MDNRFQLLQSFRGFAALLVLLFHTTLLINNKYGAAFLGDIFLIGWSGVDFFFVLSGFIIYYIHHKDFSSPESFSPYIKKRLIRVLPVYWMILFAIIPVFFLVPQFGTGGETDPLVILKAIILLPQETHILIVAWTLSFEMFFYVIFGLLILLQKRVIVPLVAAWITATLLQFANVFEPSSHLLKFLFNDYHLEFLLGCLTAYVFIKGKGILPTTYLLIGVAGFALSCAMTLTDAIPQHTSLSTLSFGISSALIILGAVTIDINGMKVPKILSLTGDASYSIYLLHYPVLSLSVKVFQKLNLDSYIGVLGTGLMLILVAYLSGLVFSIIIERRTLRFFRGKILHTRPTKVIDSKVA